MAKKIMVAEDDKMMLSLLEFKLKKEGFEPILCEHGMKAKEVLQDSTPDLVLVDIMMPFVNGLELTSYIRNDLKLEIPIMVLSSAGQEDMVMKAFSLGANDFVPKPFSPNELIIRIKRMLQS